MSKCKSCGAEILWILTRGGKNIPCDPEKVYYSQNDRTGKLVLVLPSGFIDRGDEDSTSEKFGYISHFSTCPNADFHRKSK